MKRAGTLAALLIGQLFFFSTALAGDFDWLDNLNIKAVADASGFRAKLATRFNIGDVKVKAVINSVDKLSDAYLVLRLGELSHKPVENVLNVYRDNRKRGWGVVAKKLGIKPGSREFHALKRGHDLDTGHSHGNDGSAGKGKNKGKSKHHDHNGKGKNKR